MTPLDLAKNLTKTLSDKKAIDLKVLKTEDVTTLADYFVICTATSNTHLKALSDACEDCVERLGEPIHHIEGRQGGAWLLMDFSSVVVHIFTEEARNFYDLERLWGDANEVNLDEILDERVGRQS